jgi:glycosyltransferase involved in cell wall biosynthesis
MKILYIITKSNWGGAQRHVFDLATAMKDAGHDVAVALGGDGPLRVKLEASGIYCHSISKLKRDISASDDVGSFKEIYSIIKYRRPDILHLHSPKASGIGALAGRILRVPSIVTTVHGWTWNESRPILQKAAIALSSWVTMLLCHKVILITQKDLDQAKYLPFVKDKLTLISLGMRAPIFVSVDGVG